MSQQMGDELLAWVATTYTFGGYCLYILIRSIEHGAPEIPIDPVAWDNTMAAVVWALGENVRGHIHAGVTVTPDDVERASRLRALGIEALGGGARSPELLPLAERCLRLLSGPDWRRAYEALPEPLRVHLHAYPADEG
jgi:hypothetical protein